MNRLLGATPVAGRETGPAEVEYHRVLAGEQRQIGRGSLAIVLLLGGMLVVSVVLAWVASLIDRRPGAAGPVPGGSSYTRRCSTPLSESCTASPTPTYGGCGKPAQAKRSSTSAFGESLRLRPVSRRGAR